LHHRLISVISDTLTPQIQPKYYVCIEERVYVSEDTDPGRSVIIQDLQVVVGSPRRSSSEQTAPGKVQAETAEPVELVTLLDEEIRESRLKVIDREKQQVITVIEVLSPTNKVPHSAGRESYFEKRHEIMNSPSHMVEIDLLRMGQPLFAREVIPPHDYLVHVSIAYRRPRGRVWPILLSQRLPIIGIPLRKGDADAPIDLQEILNTVYDRARYDLRFDYGTDPDPPLRGESATWAADLLKSKGLRKQRPRRRGKR